MDAVYKYTPYSQYISPYYSEQEQYYMSYLIGKRPLGIRNYDMPNFAKEIF